MTSHADSTANNISSATPALSEEVEVAVAPKITFSNRLYLTRRAMWRQRWLYLLMAPTLAYISHVKKGIER